MEEQVIKTKKGLFVRKDKNFGAIVFSPFSGLFFAIAKDFVEDTLLYCNNKTNNLSEEIQLNLSIGIDTSAKNFEIQTHWLPSKESFSYLDELPDKYPIVINWLISSKCFFNCNYCYASDVINKKFEEVDAKQIAEHILELQPLAVVLSGGEPLRETEKMIEALNVLGNKIGIIIDTNGYNYDEELTKLFVKYNAVVRISLDTLRNEDIQKIRPLKSEKQDNNVLDHTISNIFKYRKKNIPVLIHTVVSSINKNSFDDLFANLPHLGINGWRIFSVVNPNDIERKENFEKMMTFGKVKNLTEAQEDIKKKIDIFSKSHLSKSNFSLQIVHSSESAKNSVILVLPDGKIVTESLFKSEKIEIQKDNLFKKVDLKGHYERYLGKIN
jgi:MoaA/NifB/PqqE/SkfB family radical SAM enzyme